MFYGSRISGRLSMISIVVPFSGLTKFVLGIL